MSTESPKQNEQPKPKQKRTRSPGYPTTNLKDALEKAKVVWDNDGRNECPIASLATQWEFGEKSSAAPQLAAALKKYGLFADVDGKNGHVKLTDVAIRIFSDEDPNSAQRLGFIKRVALSPSIYRQLWDKYQGNLPSDPTLKTYLIADLKFNPKVVSKVIEDFRETITFAKLASNDKIDAANGGDQQEEPEQNMNEQLESGAQSQRDVALQNPPPRPLPSPPKPGAKEMRFELDCGPVVVRYPMTGDDYELLLKSLELWKKKLVAGQNPEQ
jgi:hypothetical protein